MLPSRILCRCVDTTFLYILKRVDKMTSLKDFKWQSVYGDWFIFIDMSKHVLNTFRLNGVDGFYDRLPDADIGLKNGSLWKSHYTIGPSSSSSDTVLHITAPVSKTSL